MMHNNHKGKGTYICLEGLKGAGKTTIFNYLVSRLKTNNVDFSTVSPTRSSGDKNFIERLFINYPSLKDRRLPRIFLYAHRSNFAARNAEWNRQLILGERSLVTSYATKWSGSSLLTWLNIRIINLFENKIKSPDYVIYIEVPHDTLVERIENRDKERDIDDSRLRLKQAEKAYLHMMNGSRIKRIANVHWLTVSGTETSELVGDKVYELIIQLINKENNIEKGKE